MEFKVEGSRRNRKFIEALMPSIMKQLNLDRYNKGVLIMVSADCDEDSGLTVDFSEISDCYLVLLKPARHLKDIILALAHEMVHVKQMASGKLKSVDDATHWAGKRYAKDHPYLDRPWEIEAFSRQELILRRALED